MIESGIFYGTFVDPLLKGLRKRVLHKIKRGEKVIDIACGTGAQCFAVAAKAEKVTGVDLSESMIRFAQRKKEKSGFDNLEFRVCNATDLSVFSDSEFDVAVMSLALHQFPPELYKPILSEMKRVATRIIIVDYGVPLPKNYAGIGSRIAEFMAGREHNHNFKQYYKKGGLRKIISENGLNIEKSVLIGENAFQIVTAE
jgi:demethylmenaquinone methyltransferase/2-methoxy-6-polyprenyl-1,4-benzoquinol methylase